MKIAIQRRPLCCPDSFMTRIRRCAICERRFLSASGASEQCPVCRRDVQVVQHKNTGMDVPSTCTIHRLPQIDGCRQSLDTFRCDEDNLAVAGRDNNSAEGRGARKKQRVSLAATDPKSCRGESVDANRRSTSAAAFDVEKPPAYCFPTTTTGAITSDERKIEPSCSTSMLRLQYECIMCSTSLAHMRTLKSRLLHIKRCQRRLSLTVELTHYRESSDITNLCGDLPVKGSHSVFDPPRTLKQRSTIAGDVAPFIASETRQQEQYQCSLMKPHVGNTMAAERKSVNNALMAGARCIAKTSASRRKEKSNKLCKVSNTDMIGATKRTSANDGQSKIV